MSGLRRLLIPLLFVFAALSLVQLLHSRSSTTASQYTYAGGPHSFTGQLDAGQVKSVSIDLAAQTVAVQPTSGPAYTIGYPDNTLIGQLLAQHGQVTVTVTAGHSPWWSSLIVPLLGVLLIGGFMVFMLRRMQGGGSKVMSFGKSRAKRVSVDSPKVTFADVAGVRRSRAGAGRDRRVPEEPREVPAARRAHPQGRAVRRAARQRQDAAGPGRGRRGRRAILQPVGL